MKFAELKIGEKFEFSSEIRSLCNHAFSIDGPWEKVSPRKYRSDGNGKVYKLGTTKCEVVKVSGYVPGQEFFLPTKPYDIHEAINRAAAATGSPRGASGPRGHNIVVYFNSYRGYWKCGWHWSGFVNLSFQGGISGAVARGIEEYDSQGGGADLVVSPASEADWEFCMAHPRLKLKTNEAWQQANASWKTWRHDLVYSALHSEKVTGRPYVQALLESDSAEEWRSWNPHLGTVAQQRSAKS